MNLHLTLGEKIPFKGRTLTATEKALGCMPEVIGYLIVTARHRSTVTYGTLVDDLELPYRPENMGRFLDLLSEECTRRGEPSLAALVVNQTTGEVGGDWPGGASTAAPERVRLYDHWA